MKKIKFNKTVLIYFSISWILGILGFINGFLDDEDWFLGHILFFVGFNFFINVLALIQLSVLFFTFTENRKEFFWSFILLIFNFPFTVIYWILLNIII